MSDLNDLISVKGFKILVAMPEKKVKTDGGVFLPDQHQDRENTASMWGYVLAMGPEAYKDKDKFPEGARCSVGDCVLMKSFSGYRFKLRGQEMRIINDDTVDAVVADPRLLERA